MFRLPSLAKAKRAGRHLLRIGARSAAIDADFEALVRDGRVVFGAHSYGVPRVFTFRNDPSRLIIGKYVSIADGVEVLLGGEHRVDWISTYPFRVKLGLPGAYEDGHPASRGDVVIGSDVWIARGATLLSGVTIGHGAVVGAHAVVKKSVRPYAVVVGNPAREVRRRFADEQVEALLAIAWWDWDDADVRDAIPLLCSDQIEAFIEGASSHRA